MDKKLTRPIKTLRVRSVAEKLQTARSTIFDWLNPDSPRHDPTFPKPLKLGKSVTVWIEEMIDDWIESKIVAAGWDKYVSPDLLAPCEEVAISSYMR
jgi:prophage regulatory protein